MNKELDPLALANLAVSVVTALCAIYIAYVALRHTAKPKIGIYLYDGKILACDTDTLFAFEISNVGYWYATPPAINITVYFNFDPSFTLQELRYGSAQEKVNSHVRVGKTGVTFLRATGIKLLDRGSAEHAHVLAYTPKTPGTYRLKVSAFSDNGASEEREFTVVCSG